MSWTKVSKPTVTGYTKVFSKGREAFDDVNTDFDDADVFFNGANPSAWTDVAKPSGTGGTTILAGMATGLLIPFTYSTNHTTTISEWTKVSKPT